MNERLQTYISALLIALRTTVLVGGLALFFAVAADTAADLKFGGAALEAPVATWQLRGTVDLGANMTDAAGTVRPVSAASSVAPVFPTPPQHLFRTGLIVLHVVGLLMGMGTALMLDLFLLKRLYRSPVDDMSLTLVAFGGRLVTAGLVALWTSGLGFLAFYWSADPALLANPKIWAKIAVVCLLTLNGILVHAHVIPMLRNRAGKPLLASLPLSKVAPILMVATVSTGSWLFAMVLGLVKQLNYVVSGGQFLLAYVALLAGLFALAAVLHCIASGGMSGRALPAPARKGYAG